MADKLTPEEEQELQELELLETASQELSANEEAELAQLEAAEAQAIEASKVSSTNAALKGAAQGITLGFADEIAGGLTSAFTDDTYEESRDSYRQSFEEAREQHPIAFTGGEIAGGIVGVAASGGSTLGIRGAIVAGSVAGLGNSEEDEIEGQLVDAFIGGSLGAVTEKIGVKSGRLLGQAKNYVGKIAKSESEALALKGMGVFHKTARTKADDILKQRGISPDEFLDRMTKVKNVNGNSLIKGTKSAEEMLIDIRDLKSDIWNNKMEAIYKSVDLEEGVSATKSEVLADDLTQWLAGDFLGPNATLAEQQLASKLSLEIDNVRKFGDMSLMDIHTYKNRLNNTIKWDKIDSTKNALNTAKAKFERRVNQFLEDRVSSLSKDPKAISNLRAAKTEYSDLAIYEGFVKEQRKFETEGIIGSIRKAFGMAGIGGQGAVVGGVIGGIPGAAVGGALTVASKSPSVNRSMSKTLSKVGSSLQKDPSNQRYLRMLLNSAGRSDAFQDALKQIELNLDGFIIDEEEKQTHTQQVKSGGFSTRNTMQMMQQINSGRIPNYATAMGEQPFLKTTSPKPRDEDGKKMTDEEIDAVMGQTQIREIR